MQSWYYQLVYQRMTIYKAALIVISVCPTGLLKPRSHESLVTNKHSQLFYKIEWNSRLFVLTGLASTNICLNLEEFFHIHELKALAHHQMMRKQWHSRFRSKSFDRMAISGHERAIWSKSNTMQFRRGQAGALKFSFAKISSATGKRFSVIFFRDRTRKPGETRPHFSI